jgi:DNA-binding transcriptional ArsR family regulator
MKPKSTDDTYRALADPTRRGVLERLKSGEQSVNSLAQDFSMSLPAFSRHLKVLHGAGLVTKRQLANQRFYKLNPMALKEVAHWLSEFEVFWIERLDVLGQYLNQQDQPKKPKGTK